MNGTRIGESDESRMATVKRAALIELEQLFCNPAISVNMSMADYIGALANVVIACRTASDA